MSKAIQTVSFRIIYVVNIKRSRFLSRKTPQRLDNVLSELGSSAMRKNHGMKDSSGAYVTRMDIQNAGQAWKQLNPDERAGFMSTKGSKGVEDL
ncbi:MAG: hypothetical protein M1830_003973 [Pleopsidium flavum]|nr:MAG: hypothetical protein M1830_003973 [Pleopsidium flavum]